MQITEKIAHSIEAEQSVLGLLLQWNVIDRIADYLQPEHFYRLDHRHIYEAMLELYANGHGTDIVTVKEELDRRGADIDEKQYGGATGYLSKIMVQADKRFLHADSIESHAQIIVECAISRQGLDACGQIAALFGSELPQTAIEKAQQMFFELGQIGVQGGFAPIKEHMTEYVERVNEMREQGGVMPGIPTGFHDLDRLLKGMRGGKFYILAARPGLGKTSLALAFAHHAAVKCKMNVGFLSLEMDRMELTDRLVAIDGKLDAQKVSCGELEDDEYETFIQSAGRIESSPIYIDDGFGCNSIALRSKAQRLQATHGLDMLIVDYLQLMDGDTTESNDNEVRMLSSISRRLKGLSRELNIPVLALAQLSRKVEERASKVPQLSDLRGSGSLEQDADVVMFIYRDEEYNAETERKEQADIIVAKHRGGPKGTVVLGFKASQTRFYNIELQVEA